MTIPTWYGRIDDTGRVKLDYPRGFRRWLTTLAGHDVALTVTRKVKRRSHAQNAFWWGCVVPMVAKQCGYLPNEHDAVHDELVRVLLGVRDDGPAALRIRRSTAALTTEEFTELIELAQVWCAEHLGLVIPDPDPEWFAKKERRVA